MVVVDAGWNGYAGPRMLKLELFRDCCCDPGALYRLMRPAIVIPYRNRRSYLDVLLDRLPAYLERANDIHDYRIYVAEQRDQDLFRVSLARNVGAKVALADQAWDYLVFHDVDIVPVSGADYRIDDTNIMWFLNAGGCKVHTSSFRAANGYNIRFAGWGCEDTELIRRLQFADQPLSHWPHTEAARVARMLNLEMRDMSEAEARDYSARYFGHNGDGPTYLPWSHGELGVRLEAQYAKGDFQTPAITAHNHHIMDGIESLERADRIALYQTHGFDQVDITSIEVKEQSDRIVRVRFDAQRCGGPVEGFPSPEHGLRELRLIPRPLPARPRPQWPI